MLVRGGSDVLERTREKACMLRVGVFDSIRVRGRNLVGWRGTAVRLRSWMMPVGFIASY